MIFLYKRSETFPPWTLEIRVTNGYKRYSSVMKNRNMKIIIFEILVAVASVAIAGEYGHHYDEHHSHVTYEEKTKPVEVPIYKKYAIPIPHPVPVKVPQEIKIPIPQPYQVQVQIPHPYPVEVIKEIEVPIEKPEPYVVEKKVPFIVEKPYPVYVDKKFPVPVAKPYAVHVPVYKHVYHHVSKGWH